MAYLMLRAVGTLTPMSNPLGPDRFAQRVDRRRSARLDVRKACPAAPTARSCAGRSRSRACISQPVRQRPSYGGCPARIDVYIDDGRAGEYQYLARPWATTTIWNRRAAERSHAHEEPALGDTNYAYVKIKNRGTQTANDVIVRGYHCKPIGRRAMARRSATLDHAGIRGWEHCGPTTPRKRRSGRSSGNRSRMSGATTAC